MASNDLNSVNLSGRLTRDPEVSYLQNGTALAKLSLAVNRSWSKDGGDAKQETSFVDVVQWGKGAEATGQYLTKGSGCIIKGRLRQETWDDKQTGQKRSKLSVVAEEVIFMPRGEATQNAQGGSGFGGSASRPTGQGSRPTGQRAAPPPPADDGAGSDSPF